MPQTLPRTSYETKCSVRHYQLDYSYGEVAGVKIPLRWVVTWTNGQSKVELTDVQPNVAINAARFAKPAPAVVTPIKGRAR